MFWKVQSASAIPEWHSATSFTAKTNRQDQVNRVANNALFAGGLYGFYSLCIGISGIGFYASYAAAAFTIRKIAAAILGHIVYPASLTSYPFFNFSLKQQGQLQVDFIRQKGLHIQPITLHKSGTSYDAYLISHPKTHKSGKWTIHALGNAMAIENNLIQEAVKTYQQKSNTLLINGPSVGKSGGWPTRYQMGAGFEAGLQLLESVVKASHIAMDGFSLGNGMMAEAILQHDFTEGLKNNVRYLAVSSCSFSRLSTICKCFLGRFAAVLPIAGLELDGALAAKKLSDLGIRQVALQHTSQNDEGSDGIIPDRVSLASFLHKDLTLQGKEFLESDQISHNDPIPEKIKKQLDQRLQKFFQDKDMLSKRV